MSTLLDKLDRWKPFTAIVIGDFMLDQLVFGNADRLSPEAPVPVLHVQRNEDRPGGAANVCLDLVAMRATVHAIGVTGDDREADLLRSALATSGVNSDALLSDSARPTTVKRSLIGLAQHRHPQKMFRLDSESRTPLPREVEDRLIAHFVKLLPSADVVCIEDYNKGVCTERLCQAVITAARAANVPVLVDPAAIESYAKYRGATTITPNRNEATLATGDSTPAEAAPAEYAPIAQRLLDECALDAAVITLDKHGCLLLERGGDGKPLVVPTSPRQVYDVTGAGDMVLAALAAARANDIPWHDAVRFANAAAGLEVEVFGVVPMPIEKIHHEVLLRERSLTGKLRTPDQLLIELAAVKNEGRKVVFTNGCFDILHAGHIWLLQQAKACGDYLIVAINTDDSVRRFKGPNRPVNAQHDRAAVLSALACVDAVVVFTEDTPRELIERLRPDVLAKGDEYAEAEMPGAAFIRSRGGSIVRIPMKPGLSTTAILTASGDPRAQVQTTTETRAAFTRD